MPYATTYFCEALPDLFRLPARLQLAAQFGRTLEGEGVLVTEALVSPRILKRLEDAWTPLAAGTERIAKVQAGTDPSRYKQRQEALLTLFGALRTLAVHVEKGMGGSSRTGAEALSQVAALGASSAFDRLYLARVLLAGFLRGQQKPYGKALALLGLTEGHDSPMVARIADEMAADALLSPSVLAGVTKAGSVRDQLDALLALLSGVEAAPRPDPLWTLLARRLCAGSDQLRWSVENQLVVKLCGREPFCDTPGAALLRLDEFALRLASGALSSGVRPRLAVALVDRYCHTQNEGGAAGRRRALNRLSSVAPQQYGRLLCDLSAGYGRSVAQADVVEAARAVGLEGELSAAVVP